MDQILEVLRLLEALPAVWDGLLQSMRSLVYWLLPLALGDWLSVNEWLLWGVLVIVALVLVTTLVGGLMGGE